MAEDAQSKAPDAAPQAAEVVVSEQKPAEVVVSEEKTAEVVVPEEKAATDATLVPEAEEKALEGQEESGDASVLQSVSFKEEGNVVADLIDPQKKALDELKQLVQAALANNEFKLPPPPPPPPAAPAEEKEPAKEEAPKPEEAPAAAPAATEESKAEPEESPKPAEIETPANEEALAEKPVEESVAPEKEESLPEKPVEEPVAPTKEESLSPPSAEEEKAATADEDGTKTVEAIEETVVPVAATIEEPVAPPAASKEEPAAATESAEAPPTEPPEEVFVWGVPLLGDERSDTVLLKFLRARDFKVKEAMTMLKDAVLWRKQFGIDALLEEDLGLPELEKTVFMHGVDREGHPVCYNVYGEFQNKELYEKAFGDEEKRQRFLKWRIQYLEKGIRELLDFNPGGVSSMVQVTDLRNSPGLGKHRQVTKQAVTLLQDNYPEFIAKKVFINVPWWYLAVNRVLSPFFTQRTKSKFVFAGPSKSAETLFKYIAPEQVPVAYGGLNDETDTDFTSSDPVTEVAVKSSSKHSIEIPATESCLLVWELRVLGSEASYGSEFVPQAEDGYTVIVQKTRKLVATDEPVIKGSFKIGEPGKVLLNIENPTSKKKKVLYRFKVKSSTESL